MNFTIKQYKQLLIALQSQGYFFQTFNEFLKTPQNRSIVLRHDVDLLPQNSLIFAQIEHQLGIKGTYYFRIVPQSFDPDIIKKIAALGHEIGYHYEDVDLAYQQIKNSKHGTRNPQQIFELAIGLFEKHLKQFSKYYSVQTICMHGSPLAKFDNKLLWKYFNYKDFGIIGEPYFDLDFSKVLYLTDTGRRWNGERVSVRDKEVRSKEYGVGSKKKILLSEIYRFHSTNDIIKAVEKGKLPEQIMFTFHPQRWSDKFGPWVKELVWQNVKNVGKWGLVKIRRKAEGRRL